MTHFSYHFSHYIQSFQHFLAMGGYGFYVWGSYGVVAALLLYHYCAPWVRHRRLRAYLKAQPPR